MPPIKKGLTAHRLTRIVEIRDKALAQFEIDDAKHEPFTAWQCPDCLGLNPQTCPRPEEAPATGRSLSLQVCFRCGWTSLVEIYLTGQTFAKLTRKPKNEDERVRDTHTNIKPMTFAEITSFVTKI